MKIVWLYYGDHLQHPFIRLGARTLTEHGHDVSVHDLSAGGGGVSYGHFFVSVNLLPTGIRERIYSKFSFLRFLVSSLVRTFLRRPEVIVVTMPQMVPLAIAAKFLSRPRIVYYPFELFGDQAGNVRRFWKELEMVFLSSIADAIITQNEERARIYTEERRARVEPSIVHNYKPAFTVKASGMLREHLNLSNHDKIVLYEGVLVHGRWLDKLINSAQFLPEGVFLVLMGEAKPWWEKEGKRLLENPSLGAKVRVAKFVSHEVLLGYVADADAGIIIYDDTVRNNYYCEPGKLSDYVRAGVPVIAPDFPTIGPVIRKYMIGETFESPDPEEIARVITKVVAASASQWNSGLQSAASDLVWETQKNTFLKAVTGK